MDIIRAYIIYKSDPENDSKKDTHFCQEQGIPYPEFLKIKNKNPKWARDALDLRRESYSGKMTDIDAALFTAAIGGDTKAAELIYRRFDGWNPKIIEQTNNYYNFAELVKDAEKNDNNPRTAKQTFTPV